tara:strand:- start:277 stop:690 length:414 start_codon:yes stop_codon:yes gene_type:complete
MPNEKKIFEDTENIESVIIDSDNEQIDEVIKAVEEEKAPTPAKRGRGRPKNTPVKDPKQLSKLKKNLVEGRKSSMATRKRNALLKKIDDDEILMAKRDLENKKIDAYMNSKKLTPIIEEPPPPRPKRINNMFRSVIF